MPIPFIAAAAIPSIAKGVFGAIQAARGNKLFKQAQANRPDYEIPEEYRRVLGMYQTAMAGDMPGYSKTLSNIGQSGARARGALERGAISSNAYGAGVSDLYQKELDAIQNLGIQQEQWKASQMANVAQAQGALGQQKSTQWELNEYMPWQTEIQRAGEMRKAGIENMFGALQSGIGGITDLMGTKMYTDALTKMYGGKGIGQAVGNQSQPIGGRNPYGSALKNIPSVSGVPNPFASPYEARRQRLIEQGINPDL